MTPRGGIRCYARVDVRDFDFVQRFGPWHLWSGGPNRYPAVAFTVKGHRIHLLMHTLIVGYPPEGMKVAHRNGVGLDNRRENLVFSTQSQLLAKRKPSGGTSQYKGVCWDGATGKWLVQFQRKKIGRYRDEIEAAKAFDVVARAHWGPDAYQNFPN